MSAWDKLYSEKVSSLRPSPIREMLHATRQPGMISFAGGNPDPESFPVDLFYESASILKEQGKDVLQYGTTEGYTPLKDFLCSWIAPRMGRSISQDELLITTGSTQVVDLLCWTLIDEGDLVITEEPTFVGTTLTMHNHGAQFLTIPCDADGMLVDQLPGMIENALSQGKRIKFIYTIPNFHNPLGCTMSLERRKKLVEIASKYGIVVLEDDPYAYIRFEGEDLPTLFSLDQSGLVVHACTFSKILAPGTRVAWVVGDKELIRKMAIFKQGTDLCTSVVAQALVYEYCRKGHLDDYLPHIVDHYRKKRDNMEECLKKHLPLDEVSWVKPGGGFFYWLEMKTIKTSDLYEKALEKKVAFVPGESFYPNQNGGERSLRMCFTFASPKDMDEGIRRLGEAMQELLKS